mgnify:CR=1 FL=1
MRPAAEELPLQQKDLSSLRRTRRLKGIRTAGKTGEDAYEAGQTSCGRRKDRRPLRAGRLRLRLDVDESEWPIRLRQLRCLRPSHASHRGRNSHRPS